MKEITIKLILGEGPEQSGSYCNNISENLFHVHIDANDAKQYKVPEWIIAAHEIGHVLGRTFGLANHAGMMFYGGGPAALPREEEAWDLAQHTGSAG